MKNKILLLLENLGYFILMNVVLYLLCSLMAMNFNPANWMLFTYFTENPLVYFGRFCLAALELTMLIMTITETVEIKFKDN